MKRFMIMLLMLLVAASAFCNGAIAAEAPYSVKLTAEHGIYSGPGEENDFVKNVGENGVYTIIRESYDRYGNLWGRLKSGAGWVLLAEQPGDIFSQVPYTTRLISTVDICAGPGYTYGFSCDVGEDGLYTIVEESVGVDGYLWGRLKSGVGWVRLKDVTLDITPVGRFTAYTVELADWVPVYTVPNYIYGQCAGIVGEDGVYTIIDEVTDNEGNVWGCLKSGAGWVDFTYVRTAGQPPMTAYFADVIDLENAEYAEFIHEDSEYAVRIAFRANEDVTNVRLSQLDYNGESYKVHENLNWVQKLGEDAYFVAEVVFYGDMTTYGISFVDNIGMTRYYAVMLSGKDGSVVFSEYVP